MEVFSSFIIIVKKCSTRNRASRNAYLSFAHWRILRTCSVETISAVQTPVDSDISKHPTFTNVAFFTFHFIFISFVMETTNHHSDRQQQRCNQQQSTSDLRSFKIRFDFESNFRFRIRFVVMIRFEIFESSAPSIVLCKETIGGG